MNEMVKRTWTALDGRLEFDITINRDPHDSIPSVARVHCSMGRPEEHTLTINEARPTPFNLRFRSGCFVHGYLEKRNHVHIDGVDSIGIAADMRFGITGQYDETHFEGLMVACPSRSGPAPWPPAPSPDPEPFPPLPDYPDEPVGPEPFITGQGGELFPYVYVRRWPRIADEDLRYGFIPYGTSISPPPGTFYDDLLVAARQGRTAAEDLALSFIDGVSPYAGQFVARLHSLQGPMRDFAPLALEMQRVAPQPRPWLEALQSLLDSLLGRYHLTADYFGGTAYLGELERVWQSYLALAARLGYDPALRAELSLTLWMAHAVSLATVTAPTAAEAEPANANGVAMNPLTSAQVADLAGATVVLPAAVFPLPPAAGAVSSPPRGAAHGWIEPYAIGDLQMVRQRLLRYAAGEVARIENVMRGERKETSSKRTQRQMDTQSLHSEEGQILQNDDADKRTSLLEEARRMVAETSVSNTYDNFQNNYGPPTQATLNGSWTRTTKPGADAGLDDKTRFAREVLNKTVNRITRKVGTVRASSTLNQVEDTVTSVIDNTGGTANVSAVFRWVNKVYEAFVVNYGNRLMMEFLIPHPAARFVVQQSALSGERALRPVPLGHLALHSFEDISPDNYARLAAAYGVTELQPPPLALRFVTASLRGGEEKQLAVPAGYCALNAMAGYIGTPAGLPPPQVLVGRQLVAASSGGATGTTATPLQAYGEDTTLPVSATDVGPTLSPPSDPQVLVNVEVQCVPTRRAMDEWRIGVYGALVKAYERQLGRYQGEATGSGTHPVRSPLANRQIEQRELRQACMRLLMERMATLTGAAGASPWGSPPSPAVVYEPRVVQFLDAALEWPEMAYSFHNGPGGLDHGIDVPALGGGDDAMFTGFLQAEQARVLLPVQPQHVMAFLYFFCSGMVWDGSDREVPALSDDVALINDLKHAAPNSLREQRVGRAWQVVVPTAMQVLDESGGSARSVAATLTLPAEGA